MQGRNFTEWSQHSTGLFFVAGRLHSEKTQTIAFEDFVHSDSSVTAGPKIT